MGVEALAAVGGLSALVIALTQLAKVYVKDAKYYPVISLLLGVVLSVLTGGVGIDQALNGLVIGLTASGLYSSSKTITQ